ncbi:MAG TPA: hypothetical protein PKC03_06405 [Dokdonella sp.]|jgi:hypothetical protein|nr:hypothetical protein [Dokdonella sp.]
MLRQTLQAAACVLGFGLLLACSKPAADDPQPAVDPAATPAARPATVLDEQLKALDKAKAVEQQLQKEKADQDKAIEDAGG